jgi:hypothetical protein
VLVDNPPPWVRFSIAARWLGLSEAALTSALAGSAAPVRRATFGEYGYLHPEDLRAAAAGW